MGGSRIWIIFGRKVVSSGWQLASIRFQECNRFVTTPEVEKIIVCTFSNLFEVKTASIEQLSLLLDFKWHEFWVCQGLLSITCPAVKDRFLLYVSISQVGAIFSNVSFTRFLRDLFEYSVRSSIIRNTCARIWYQWRNASRLLANFERLLRFF